jgi:undecaprenyl-diphosphatase
METLIELDESLFFFLNGLHADWLDPIMFFISKTTPWIPLFAVMVYLLFKQFGWNALWWLLAIAVAITLADQITSGFMKPFFERFRPSRNPAFEEGAVHIVNDYRGGRFGFASSHAANSFATATILYLILRNHYTFIGLIFLYAVLVSYSRIYLGVHYPGDIVTGAAIGAACALICYKGMKVVLTRRQLKKTV